MRIGVDLMGGEASPILLFQALSEFAKTLPPSISILAIGDLSPPLSASPILLHHTSEVIWMEDSPLLAIRRKKNSSLCVGIRLLKEKAIDALVSAGNTGALVGYAKAALSTFSPLLRPALLTLIPAKTHPIAVLDVGANLSCKASHLVQFALLGAAYQCARENPAPIVGLLNIGKEALKGTSELRLAYRILQKISSLSDCPFRFAGNIEGKAVLEGLCNTLITDGFTGNIFLKTAEGIAEFILKTLPPDTCLPLSYAEYSGALLCGVRGIVIKCHGDSSASAFINALTQAIQLHQEDLLQKIEQNLTQFSVFIKDFQVPPSKQSPHTNPA